MSDTDFVTLMTFTYPHEVALIRGYLEAEGIDVFVKDEMTAQVHNFYSNAIGGIKLQVPQAQLDHAVEIVRDGGFLTPEQMRAPEPTWLDRIVAKFSRRK
ncbi:MAG: DUF2007 domain-containing protein [Rikenellaceae bacterium]|jgi:hypothetical protein|nr:DUF2007 domain-containing protein [Rikenellaceae bacterium]